MIRFCTRGGRRTGENSLKSMKRLALQPSPVSAHYFSISEPHSGHDRAAETRDRCSVGVFGCMRQVRSGQGRAAGLVTQNDKGRLGASGARRRPAEDISVSGRGLPTGPGQPPVLGEDRSEDLVA